MIAGVKRQDLTLETVLKRASEYDIYRYYLGHDFKLGEPFSSPFHKDRDPSFSIIRTRNNRLHFTDFAGDNASGKVIDFVRRFYPGKNFNEILRCIDRDLNLGIVSGAIVTPKLLSGRSGGEIPAHDDRALIQVIPRAFTRDELRYWNLYHLDESDLKADPQVYAIDRLYVDKVQIYIAPGELIFGYLYEDRYWKIYRPLAKTRKGKWISNVPATVMYGMKDLLPGKPVLTIKAHKDLKIFRKFYQNSCGFQHEGIHVISEENISFLTSNFPAVYMNCDPDPAGTKALKYFVTQHKFRPLVVPSELRSNVIKDFADLARYKGLDKVIDFVNKKTTLV